MRLVSVGVSKLSGKREKKREEGRSQRRRARERERNSRNETYDSKDLKEEVDRVEVQPESSEDGLVRGESLHNGLSLFQKERKEVAKSEQRRTRREEVGLKERDERRR